MKPRHVIVLGLGTFGAAIARRLTENGCRVTGVDSHEERVAELQDVLFAALVADVTDRRTLEQLPIEKADAVVLSLGEDFARSILASLHLLELRARRIVAKVVSPEHEKILKKLGVHDTIFPEVEIARQWADRLTWPNILEELALGAGQIMAQMSVPGSLCGKTIREANLRAKHGITVLGLKNTVTDTEFVFNPPPDTVLNEDQILLVVGQRDNIERFREMG
jgi:trk system potassium uptake protein TrkA